MNLVKNWAAARNLTYMIMLDTYSRVWSKYGMGYIPHNVVLDPNMVVQYTNYGYEEGVIINVIEQQLVLASVPAKEQSLPTDFSLSQNYPNPFNAMTFFDYTIDKESHVVIKIISIDGKEIRTVVDANKPAGHYRVKWNGKDAAGRDVASGVYLIKMMTGRGFLTKKMIKLD